VGRWDQTERAQMQQAMPTNKQIDENIHQRQAQLTCRSISLAVAICLLAIGVASQHFASLWKRNGCNERGVCSLPASPLCFQVGGIWRSVQTRTVLMPAWMTICAKRATGHLQ
jgi:hypothetical protein